MSEPVNETGLVKQIVRGVMKVYPTAFITKIHGGPMQAAGLPDLLIIVDGLLIAAEVKHRKPGESETHARERATAIQRAQIGKINNAGAMAGVVLSLEETLDLIRRAFVKHETIEKRTL